MTRVFHYILKSTDIREMLEFGDNKNSEFLSSMSSRNTIGKRAPRYCYADILTELAQRPRDQHRVHLVIMAMRAKKYESNIT